MDSLFFVMIGVVFVLVLRETASTWKRLVSVSAIAAVVRTLATEAPPGSIYREIAQALQTATIVILGLVLISLAALVIGGVQFSIPPPPGWQLADQESQHNRPPAQQGNQVPQQPGPEPLQEPAGDPQVVIQRDQLQDDEVIEPGNPHIVWPPEDDRFFADDEQEFDPPTQ